MEMGSDLGGARAFEGGDMMEAVYSRERNAKTG
jgi:hypothetical protein